MPDRHHLGRGGDLSGATARPRVPHDDCNVEDSPLASGLGNLCHDALDRHVPHRPDEPALVCMATPGTCEHGLSYGQLYVEVQRMAAIQQDLGIGLDAHVLMYLPMISEAVIAMLAAARLGALHTWACDSLSERDLAQLIDRVQPDLIITTDANAPGRHPAALKSTLDEALLVTQRPGTRDTPVLVINQHRVAAEFCPQRDHDYHALRREVLDASVPCTWVPHGHLSQHQCHNGPAARTYAPLLAGMSAVIEPQPTLWTAPHASLEPSQRRVRRPAAMRRFTRSSGG